MKKDIEIEVRGSLTKDKFDELVKFFDKNAEPKDDKHRIVVDYSTFLPGGIEDRDKDIRIRTTNGIPEMIVKLGRWGENEQRQEVSVFGQNGDFDKFVQLYAALGFKKGILAERLSKVYVYKDIEFALVTVPGHSYYFEAEKMAHQNEDADQLQSEIEKVCAELGLKIFSRQEFFDYVHLLNKESNEVFDYKDYQENYFKNRFNI